MKRSTVAVPPDVAEHLGDPPEGVEVVIWDGTVPVPDHARGTAFWVPSYTAGPDRRTIRDVLDQLTDLQVVQLLSAGVEQWQELIPEGVTLCSGRSVHGGTTAELAVALTLATVRDLPRYVEQQAGHAWEPHPAATVVGSTVLVLGAGDIGRRVAGALGALDAEVVQVAREPREGVVTMSDVPALLPGVDVVVVAVPHTAETAGLVDAAFLARMKAGAVLVNIARGAVVDTDALVTEVTAGRLRAALDVTDPEPLPGDHPLWGLPGVLLTPHVGGGAAGWEDRAARLVRAQLERWQGGDDLLNVVSGGY